MPMDFLKQDYPARPGCHGRGILHLPGMTLKSASRIFLEKSGSAVSDRKIIRIRTQNFFPGRQNSPGKREISAAPNRARQHTETTEFMSQQLLAKPVVEELQADTRARAEAFRAKHGRAPRLAVVLVGEDPGSVIYTTRKGEAATRAGLEHETITFPASATPQEVRAAVERLNRDPGVDGILVQRPLPRGFREEELVYWIHPAKDVDAFHPENTGRLALGLSCLQPCTPSGVMALLRHYGIDPARKLACVIGRSSIVGKPMASLLLQADATVLHCHSKTPSLAAVSRQADILVAAVGRPRFVTSAHVKPGAIVIDVGINRDAAGRVVGDVDAASVEPIASAITPVPGGVGPMTIAMLLQNTIWAAERRQEGSKP